MTAAAPTIADTVVWVSHQDGTLVASTPGAIDRVLRRVGPTAWLLLCFLSGPAWPATVGELADWLGVRPEKVEQAIVRLRKFRYLEAVRDGDGWHVTVLSAVES